MKRVAKVILILIGLFPLYIIMFSLYASTSRLSDDNDIRYSPELIRASNNAYVTLLPELQKIKEGGYKETGSVVDELLKADSFEREMAEKLLDQYAVTLAVYADAMELESFQVPIKESASGAGDTAYMPELVTISRLAAVNIRYLMDGDHLSEAADEVMHLMHYGELIQQGDGGFITFLIGALVKQRALALLEQLGLHAGSESLPYAVMGDHVSRSCYGDAVIKSLKREYALSAATLYSLEKDIQDEVSAGNEALKEYRTMTAKLKLGYFYNESATIRKLADYYRQEIINARGHYRDIRHDRPTLSSNKVVMYADLLAGNAIGKILLNIMLPSGDRILDAQFNLEARCSTALTALAVKTYEAEHHRLPDDLDELTSGYISEIPRDPFGELLAFERAQNIVYSRGQDMEDNSGDNEKDIVFKVGR